MNPDRALFRLIHGLRTGWLDVPMRWLAANGYYLGPVLLLVALLVRKRPFSKHFRDGVLAWFVATLVAEEWVKPLFHRARPPHDAALRGFVHVLGRTPPVASMSFPSGTTAALGAVCAMLWIRNEKKLALVAIGITVLAAFSRVYIGVHYPGDMLGGAVVGVLCAYAVQRFCSWSEPLSNPSP
ncbi:MAG: phosphatase PAP2 family protein [Deltaproteobacteria bacterium]|nr:phosphatase PAP2 family protein [Deltaproteobacteria bacterium]